MLYLLKSAINNQFLQENLHILALPHGGRYTVRYAARWVAPEILGSVSLDEPVCLVLSDRPYDRLVPIRRGRVMDVTDEAGDLTLDIAWGAFVNGVDIAGFSERFSELGKRRYFVFRDPAPPLQFLTQTDDEASAWRRTVRALRESPGDGNPSMYAESVFLRPRPVTREDGRPLSPDEALRAAHPYQQPLDYEAPAAGADRDAPHRLLLEPAGSDLQVPDSIELPPDTAGRLAIPLHPTAPGDTGVTLWVTPRRARSTTLTLDYHVVEPLPPEEEEKLPREEVVSPPMERAELVDRDLRAIFAVVAADDPADRDLLDLIDRTLKPLAPASHYLREQRGMVLYRLHRWQEAHEQFASLDPGRLRAPAVVAWFVSACRAGIEADFEAILEHFDAWDQRALTSQLIEVLPMVSDGRRLQLLQDAWLGKGRPRDLWATVKDTFSRPAHILKVARLMADPDLYREITPAQGYTYLCKQVRPISKMPMDVLEQAVAWGLEARDHVQDLEHLVLELVVRRLRQGEDPIEAYDLVQELRDLSPYVWSEGAEKLADAFARDQDPDWRAEACRLYVELARVQREQFNNLDRAGDLLTRAHHLVGRDAELAERVDAEEEAWQAGVIRLDSVQEIRDQCFEVRRQRLREQLSGKRAIFVGGVQRGFDVEEIRRELGLAEAEFVPHFHSERGSLGKVRDAIRHGKVDYVIDFIRWGAHRNLDGDCDDCAVTYVRVPRSRSLTWIMRALAKVHDVRLD